MSTLSSALTGVRGERVALADVSVSAVLRDLLAEVTVRQTYRNDESSSIEAVYTFPLPLDAVLLELRVEVGGRVLNGVVVEKTAAEERYEDAVAAGDAAVMLEAIEPGLFAMNVGNLLPEETATITLSYAIVYRWAGDGLRVLLPTTIAPRFGRSPHAPHQAPESSLTVENQFSLEVDVFGSLRQAELVCPSHDVSVNMLSDRVAITLKQAKAVMDRDFILNVKAPHATRNFALCGADGDVAAAIASFQPVFPGPRQSHALDLAIVIDCSGSMQGDSISQARQALAGILDALQPHDRMTLVAFGNTTKVFSDRLLPCNPANVDRARRFSEQLEADMGGTKVGPALQAAYSATSGSQSAYVFVLTDGEVSSWEPVVADAKRSGCRVFTVGVGSAVSEAFVRGLAVATGGECELVSPREGMADRVIRHFARMRAPLAKRVAIHWPEGAEGLAPATLGPIFEGDTVTASARFDRPLVTGHVTLEIETDGGEVFRQDVALSPAPESADEVSTVARLAASARLKELDRTAGLETALRYRLVSPWTNWLVVAERPEGEKAQGIPALRKVPQTLAAGWSGAGMVAFAQRAEELAEAESRTPPAVVEPFRRIIALIEDKPSKLNPRYALELLREVGLMSEFDGLLAHAQKLGLNVNAIAATILAEILGGVLREFSSPRAHAVFMSLDEQAQRARQVLHELEGRAEQLMESANEAVHWNVIEPQLAHEVEEAVRRLAESTKLLARVRAAAELWVERIRAEHAHQVEQEERNRFMLDNPGRR